MDPTSLILIIDTVTRLVAILLFLIVAILSVGAILSWTKNDKS